MSPRFSDLYTDTQEQNLPLFLIDFAGKEIDQTFQYSEGQHSHSASDMARAAEQFFITLQAQQGQPNIPATVTGILCPDWDEVKHNKTPMQPDQKSIYLFDSCWEWC